MPDYRIGVTSSDGVIENLDLEAIRLDGIGAARALVVETLLKASRDRPSAGRSRTITATSRDERGA